MSTSQRIVEKSDFGPDFIGTLVPNLKLMILSWNVLPDRR